MRGLIADLERSEAEVARLRAALQQAHAWLQDICCEMVLQGGFGQPVMLDWSTIMEMRVTEAQARAALAEGGPA